MLSIIKSKKLWVSLLIGVFGFCSAILLAISDLFMFDLSVVEEVFKENGDILTIRLISTGIYSFIFSICSYLIGCKLYTKFVEKTESLIESIKRNKKNILLVLGVGIILPLILYILDLFVYTSNVTGFVSIKFNLYNLFSTVLYNGVIEELWFRYGLMSLFIFAIYKVFSKNKEKIENKYILCGVIFTSLFLFVFQLNSVIGMYGFSWLVLLRASINYFILNLIYSYFCIKYGLKSSIFIHILFIIFYIGVYPILFSFI